MEVEKISKFFDLGGLGCVQVVQRVEKRTIRPTNSCLFEIEQGDGKLLGHVVMFLLLMVQKK